MWYGNGDNNLEHYIVGDFLEMQRAIVYGSSITVVAIIDRTPGYSIVEGDWTDTRLYEIKFNSAGNAIVREIPCESLHLTVEHEEEINLGNSKTLGAFVDFAMETYPSDYYALIIGGHGSGWLPSVSALSISSDSTSFGSSIAIGDLKQALFGRGIHVIIMDACLMGGIEVAYELKNCAQYFVASPANITMGGYDYAIMLELFQKKCASPRKCASAFVEGYALSNPNFTEGMYAYDVTKIADIVESGLVDDFTAHLVSLGKEKVRNLRNAAISYRYGGLNVFIDLVDFARQASFSRLSEALRGAIEGKSDEVHISIYYPEKSSDYISSYQTAIDFTNKTNWDEYLAWYYSMQ